MYKHITSTVILSLFLLCPFAYSMQPLPGKYPDLFAHPEDARFLGAPNTTQLTVPSYTNSGINLTILIGADDTEKALEAIDAGAPLNALFNGQAPLHVAARRGNLDVVKRLLLKGAEVNLEDSSGYTPLYHALNTGQSDIARILLSRGASEQTSGYRSGLFQLASSLRVSNDLIEQLKERTSISNRRNSIGHLPICDAIRAKKFELAYSLIASADTTEINRREDDGRTALHQAVAQQDLALHDTGLLVTLLQQGANIDIADNQGITPRKLAQGRSQKIEHFLVKTALERQSRGYQASVSPVSSLSSTYSSNNSSDDTSLRYLSLFGIGTGAVALVTYYLLRDK